MKKIKWVFQGDSITDAGRDRRNYHDMGTGYPKYASEIMTATHPEIEFEFINQGISGNRTSQLFDRFYADALSFEPDVISILIGVNDVWHRDEKHKIATTDAQIELNYRCILERIRKESNAKIVMLAPFVLDQEPFEGMREDVERLISIIKRLADEFADIYIPSNEYFAEAIKTQPEPHYYSNDGVHPNINGKMFLGECYARDVDSLLKQF